MSGVGGESMQPAVDIGLLSMALGYLLLSLPLFLFWYYRTSQLWPALVAALRMTLQLFAIGLYLEYIFRWNLWWVNFGWVVVMALIAAATIVRRSELKLRDSFFPVAGSVLLSLFSVLLFFLTLVIGLENPFDAWYLVPIAGMILGNSLNASIIALRSFHQALQREKERYLFYLMSGATRHEASFLFVRDALRTAFQPQLATMANMGLISLPGMMTGQILGGSSPGVAIKYQIMIMVAILSATAGSAALSLYLSGRRIEIR